MILPIFFRITSLALGQSYDCPGASEVILKNMGKYTNTILLRIIAGSSTFDTVGTYTYARTKPD